MEGIAYMKKIILSIDGMTCSACSNGLEKYLLKQDGIINASVNLVMSNALVEYDETKLNIKNVEEFVIKAGFKSLGLYTDIKTKNNTKNKLIYARRLFYNIFNFINYINVCFNGTYDWTSYF